MSNVGFSISLKDTSTCSSALPRARIWTSDLPITSRPALPADLQPPPSKGVVHKISIFYHTVISHYIISSRVREVRAPIVVMVAAVLHRSIIEKNYLTRHVKTISRPDKQIHRQQSRVSSREMPHVHKEAICVVTDRMPYKCIEYCLWARKDGNAARGMQCCKGNAKQTKSKGIKMNVKVDFPWRPLIGTLHMNPSCK